MPEDKRMAEFVFENLRKGERILAQENHWCAIEVRALTWRAEYVADDINIDLAGVETDRCLKLTYRATIHERRGGWVRGRIVDRHQSDTETRSF